MIIIEVVFNWQKRRKCGLFGGGDVIVGAILGVGEALPLKNIKICDTIILFKF